MGAGFMANNPAERRADDQRVRLDKWLWAARFYKTRGLAKAAIGGGKVRVNEARAKAAKTVAIGDTVTVSRGQVPQTVIVNAVAERRGSAAVAALLYTETTQSIAAREDSRTARRLWRDGLTAPKRRPDKKQRRQLREMKTLPRDAPLDD